MANYLTENFVPTSSGGNLGSTTFGDESHSTAGATRLPSGWVKFSDTTSVFNGAPIGTAFSGTQIGPAKQTQTWGDQTTDGNYRTKQWVIMYSGTASGNTGPSGGRNPSNNNHTTTGENARYLAWEGSSIGAAAFSDANSQNRSLGLIRTGAIDLTSLTSSDTLELTGYFHAFGMAIGAFGVACTTSNNDASSSNEAFTGSGFTGFTVNTTSETGGGGCDIDYASSAGGSINTYGVSRIKGQKHTSNGAQWSPFKVDLTGAGGQTVYIYFLYEAHNQYSKFWGSPIAVGGNYWRSDFAITDLSIDDTIVPDTDYKGKIFNIAGSSIANIYGQDLDEGDKVFVSDGENTASNDTTINFTNSFTGTGSLSGTALIRIRNSSGVWQQADSQNLANSGTSWSFVIPEATAQTMATTSNNLAVQMPKPAGDYTLQSLTVDSVTPGNAVYQYTHLTTVPGASYITGYNRTPGSVSNITLNWST